MITQYLLPESADAAVAELASGAAVMGGGTTVMPAVHAGTLDAERVVGLARAGLEGIEREHGRTTIGAMTPLAAVAGLDGAVGEAAAAVGGPALRNMATIGGNLLVGAPYGDVGVALLALEAQVTLSDRTIPSRSSGRRSGQARRSSPRSRSTTTPTSSSCASPAARPTRPPWCPSP